MNRRHFLTLLGLTTAGAAGVFSVFRTKNQIQIAEPGVITRHTTIDNDIDELARKVIAAPVRRRKVNGRKLPRDVECAFVCIENATGNVRSFIPNASGRNEDYARSGKRDAGSVIKPIIYAIALSTGAFDGMQTFFDGPQDFPRFDEPHKTYSVENFGGHYQMRDLTIPEAIALSSNVAATAATHKVKPNVLTAKFDEIGFPITSLGTQALNLVGIGRYAVSILELASAYAAIANGGIQNEPRFLLETKVRGQDSTESSEVIPGKSASVFDPAACAVVLSGMEGCLQFGTGKGAADLLPFARAKTGSTQDALAAIVTKSLSAVLWIGRRESNTNMNMTGGSVALPLLANFFRQLNRRRPNLFPRWD
jgi:membrane peptidoglycan carboxypeptidase